MDFLNKLTKKAKETYGVATKKTGEIAQEAKLKMKMNENKAEIRDLYQEIGKKVYEKHTLSEGIDIKVDLEEECTKIDILSAEIETCLNKIRELKDKKQCPNCFNEIDLDSRFCNHCGTKQEVKETRDVEVVTVESDDEPINKNNENIAEQHNLNENSNTPEIPNAEEQKNGN